MKKPWARARRPQLERHLGLLRWWLQAPSTWIESYEIRELYGDPMKRATRRNAERDLRALQDAGVPLEWKKGYWRLTTKARQEWLKIR